MNNLNYKVIVDKIGQSNVTATICHRSTDLLKPYTKTYLWKDKEFIVSDEKYRKTFSSTHPQKSLEKLVENLGSSQWQIEPISRPEFYGNTNEYELFVFNAPVGEKEKTVIFFLRDDDVKEVVLKGDYITSYQITQDFVYLYSRRENNSDILDILVYKINTKNYEVSELDIPINLFDIHNIGISLDEIFIKDDVLLITTSHVNPGTARYDYKKGVILRYDLKTKRADTVYTDYEPAKAFRYKNGYLIIGTEYDTTNRICLKYYDKDLKLLKTNYLNFQAEHGNLLVGYFDLGISLYDDKLYANIGVDGRRIRYLTVMDAASGEALYIAEYINKERGYVHDETRFHLNDNGNLVELK
jgi:hypothetical protein